LQDSAFLAPSGFRFRLTQDAITSLNITNKLVFVIGSQRVFREVETFYIPFASILGFKGVKNILSLNPVISNFHPVTDPSAQTILILSFPHSSVSA
jgi:hypothetical protein